MPNTSTFSDGRIKLFSYIMDNLGTYTCFQYGSNTFVSIAGNTVSFCTPDWYTKTTFNLD